MKKVIELIMETGPWQQDGIRTTSNEVAGLTVGYQEPYPRKLVKTLGKSWNRLKMAWDLAYSKMLPCGWSQELLLNK